MKIAVSSDDGITISGHAGKCLDFLVYELNADQTIRQKQVHLGTNELLKDFSGPLSSNPQHPLSGIDAFITQSLGEGLQSRLNFDGISIIQTQETYPLDVINTMTLTLKN